MELGSILKWLAYAIMSTVFLREVIVSIMKWKGEKVSMSVEETKSKYVKFPSISICLDQDADKEEIGFKNMMPINETFGFLHYVRHFDNGYVFGSDLTLVFFILPLWPSDQTTSSKYGELMLFLMPRAQELM